MAEQPTLIHQLRQARTRQLAQVHFAQRLPGQLNQLGPQAVVILIIHAEEALFFQLSQQQIGGTFRNTQFVNNGRRAAGTDAGDQIENINGAGQRRDFA